MKNKLAALAVASAAAALSGTATACADEAGARSALFAERSYAAWTNAQGALRASSMVSLPGAVTDQAKRTADGARKSFLEKGAALGCQDLAAMMLDEAAGGAGAMPMPAMPAMPAGLPPAAKAALAGAGTTGVPPVPAAASAPAAAQAAPKKEAPAPKAAAKAAEEAPKAFAEPKGVAKSKAQGRDILAKVEGLKWIQQGRGPKVTYVAVSSSCSFSQKVFAKMSAELDPEKAQIRWIPVISYTKDRSSGSMSKALRAAADAVKKGDMRAMEDFMGRRGNPGTSRADAEDAAIRNYDTIASISGIVEGGRPGGLSVPMLFWEGADGVVVFSGMPTYPAVTESRLR